MKGLSVNISGLYTEHAFSDRFAAAQDDGFEAVEFWPWEDPVVAVAAVARTGLTVSNVNIDPGPDGSHGQLAQPGAEAWWRSALGNAIRFAQDLNCKTVCALTGNRDETLPLSAQLSTAASNLARSVELLEAADLTLVLEPIGPDRPAYLTKSVAEARALFDAAGSPAHIGLLFDAYHLHQTERDTVAVAYERNAHWVSHIQFSDHPGRGEPGTGNIDWTAFMQAVESSGYPGWVAFEGFAHGDTATAVDAVKRLVDSHDKN